MRRQTTLRCLAASAAFLALAACLPPPGAAAASPTRSWYFAEGSTDWGFEEYVCVQNPAPEDATVRLTYMFPDGRDQAAGLPFTVKPYSRATVNIAEAAPRSDVSVKVESNREVVCERSMYWGGRVEGHNSVGITVPGRTWYLAEGCTDYGFEEYLCLQNPTARDAAVKITYNTPGGPVSRPTVRLDAHARKTIRVNDDVPAGDVSVTVDSDRPIVAERSMYWDARRGGHNSIGTDSPAREWFLAEGSTRWGFDTYILLQNPGGSGVTASITFLTEAGPVKGPDLPVGAGSRRTVDARAYVGDADFSTRVASDGGIICERSMYWNNGSGKAGHDTIGVKQASNLCFLAEGTTAYGFETFVLIANPNPEENDVQVTYMTPHGEEVFPGVTIAPWSRMTIDVNAILPGTDVSVQVSGNYGVAVERAMYWNGRGGGHDSIGFARSLEAPAPLRSPRLSPRLSTP